MNPKLSIVIPVAAAWVPYLQRTVKSIAMQDCDLGQVEVIIAVDGGDRGQEVRKAIRPNQQGFRCVIVDSLRPHGQDIPHRNHTRNAGCDVATGEILWVLDADQMMEQGTINSLLEIYDKCKERNVAPVIIFPMYKVSYSPKGWLSFTNDWLNDREALTSLFGRMRFSTGEWDGFTSHYRKFHNSHKSVPVRIYQENMPAFPAFLYKALRGFDERFLYWGGNKVEFTQRLNFLSQRGWLETRVITNRRIIHQSHPNDPMRVRFDLKPIKQNAERFHRIVKDMGNRVPWWVETTQRVSKALRENGFVPRVGVDIVCVKPCAQLVKDAKSLAATLDTPLHFIFGHCLRKRVLNCDPWITYVCPSSDNNVLAAHAGVMMGRYKKFAILDFAKQPKLTDVMAMLKTQSAQPQFDTDNSIAVMTQEQYRQSGGLAFNAFSDLSCALRELKLRMQGPEIYKNNLVEFIGDYKLTVPAWSALNVRKLDSKPKISLGIITYNRMHVLEQCVDSLIESLRPDLFDYDIVISDDCSQDGTREYLQELHHPDIRVLLNDTRRGVAAQNNRLMVEFNDSVEFGFLSNDDLLFSTGWEELYALAMAQTGFAHYTFTDLALETKINPLLFPPHLIREINGIHIVNWRRMRIQGCFVTFNQKVLDKVGGMDSERFRLFGHEHVDWTVRNRRAGLAPGGIRWTNGAFDVLGSHNVLALNLENYRRSTSPEDEIYNTEAQFNLVENLTNRVYLPLTNGIEEEVCNGA